MVKEEVVMPNRDPLLTLLYRLGENQNALGCAIAELATWADSCGSSAVADRTRKHLRILVENAELIGVAIEKLTAASAAESRSRESGNSKTRQ